MSADQDRIHSIETEGLTRSFGRTEAVIDLTLAVPRGSIFAFLGPNGAGKTTTIKMLMNILRPSAGKATVFGVDSSRLGPEEFRQIGYVSENQDTIDWMTVEQLIAYCKPMYPTWDDALCGSLLRQFDLPPDQKIKNLSRGMRMKAMLLSSLAYRPRLLVLDEPFTGLDALVRDELVRGILELTQQEQWTVFISSHDVDELEGLADWIAVVNKGRLQLSESLASLQSRFRSVQVVVEGDEGLPPARPAEWMLPEKAGHTLRFVHSRYREGSEDQIRAMVPQSGRITAHPMSLRSIFVALARTYRISE
ncbi:MAG TPA: ABC transporter ATP-binding protein [Acidobacteriota bacterium]|jgi:ABC-2 type transport system ATP-binding protein